MKKRIDIAHPNVQELITALKNLPADSPIIDSDLGFDTGIALELENIDTIDENGNPAIFTTVNMYVYNTHPDY